MKNIRLFNAQNDALGQAKTPIVYYIKNFQNLCLQVQILVKHVTL